MTTDDMLPITPVPAPEHSGAEEVTEPALATSAVEADFAETDAVEAEATDSAPEAPVSEMTETSELPEASEALAEEPAVEEVVEELAEPEIVEEVPPPPPVPSNKHWYVVKVQSGREESIKEAIERKVKIEGLEEYYGQIYIPTEKITEMVKGKRRTRERKVLPGYIMAEVEYNDRILYLFRETSGVGDFVGGSLTRAPIPMTQREIDHWMGVKPEPGDEGKIQHNFEKGDRVKVKEGMFKDMEGEVKEILEAKHQVKVELTIFGRPVTVEMEYWQVEQS